jgi:hypothetical protein
MSDLNSTIQVILQSGGYSTWDAHISGRSVIAFEDQALMGFAVIFESTGKLLADWKITETIILNKYAPRLIGAGEKAWNVYCGFLTEDYADEDQLYKIRAIEEDLERTRKMAAANLTTRDAVTFALLPLLPILTKPVIAQEDALQRLKRRIAVISPGLEDAVLDSSIDVNDIINRLDERL